MLSLFIIASLLFTGYGIKSPSTSIKDYYGDSIVYVLDYEVTDLGILEIIKTNKIKPDEIEINKILDYSSESQCFDNILDVIGDIDYNEAQNNPNNIKAQGGNCQAYTLLLDAYCKAHKLESTIGYNNIHMYNIIKIDGVWYNVDLINGIMEKQEGI